MKIARVAKDGGPKSSVTGFFLVELKKLFSVVFLKFNTDEREVYHSHAFNALTWVLWGELIEERKLTDATSEMNRFRPSFKPKFTPRSNIHRVHTEKPTYVLTLRGPWSKFWIEDRPEGRVTLTHGRIEC